MKQRSVIVSLAVILALVPSCVKDTTISKNFAAKKYFDSWVNVNYPDAEPTTLGAYILENIPGTGTAVGSAEDHPYVSMNFRMLDLDGNITEYSDSNTAKQMHEFSKTKYYGPEILFRGNNSLLAGLEDVIKDMKVGGKRTAAIPGWLAVADRYATAQEYLDKCTGTEAIYELEITDVISDMAKYQVDSIERYISHHFQKTDSTKWGFYYIQTCPPTDTSSFSSGDNVYINYTGRLLNDKVFDTSVRDSAKVHGLDMSRSYGRSKVTLADDYTQYTFEGTSGMITGFAYCISLMKTGEKGIAVFTSDWGYQSTSSDGIPAFSPLRFDIEMIGKQ